MQKDKEIHKAGTDKHSSGFSSDFIAAKSELNFDDVWERMRQLTGWKKYGDLADYLKITSQSVSGVKRRGIMPIDWAYKVARGYNGSTDWLLSEVWPMRPGDNANGKALASGGEYVHIPRFEVAASAGGGAVVHSEQIVDYLSFRADWVRSTLGVSVRDLALISVIGDSMEPSLSEGDVVLLDMTTTSVLDGSIYALQLNGGLLVKRIQRMLDGSLVVKSDNARYDTETVSEDKADRLKVIGRVVWVGRRL